MYSVRFCYERTTPEYNITSGRNCESLATLDMYRYLGCILMLYNLTVSFDSIRSVDGCYLIWYIINILRILLRTEKR